MAARALGITPAPTAGARTTEPLESFPSPSIAFDRRCPQVPSIPSRNIHCRLCAKTLCRVPAQAAILGPEESDLHQGRRAGAPLGTGSLGKALSSSDQEPSTDAKDCGERERVAPQCNGVATAIVSDQKAETTAQSVGWPWSHRRGEERPSDEWPLRVK